MCAVEAGTSAADLLQLQMALQAAERLFSQCKPWSELVARTLLGAKETELALNLRDALELFLQEDWRVDPAVVSAASAAYKEFQPFHASLDKKELEPVRELLPKSCARRRAEAHSRLPQ